MWSVILLIFGVHQVFAELHSLQYFYTGTTGLPDFPQFVAVGIVDGKEIDYYDSIIGKNVLKQAWMEGTRDNKRTEDVRKGHQESFANNIKIAMERFNQTVGIHTVQFMYGCEWDDETGATNGFEEDGYDGEDWVSLDLKEMRYISPVQQALATVNKWNNDKSVVEYSRQYLNNQCIEWLKKYLQYGKSSLQKIVSPKVSLLQKDSSSPVLCHATGFYPNGVTITWMNNGQEHHEDVEVSEVFPNEDGTFQKYSTLRVTPDEWKKNQYTCVVEHKSETITKILTDDEIRTNEMNPVPIGIIVGVIAAVVLLVVTGVVGYLVYQKKKGFKPVSASDDGSNSSAHTDPTA